MKAYQLIFCLILCLSLVPKFSLFAQHTEDSLDVLPGHDNFPDTIFLKVLEEQPVLSRKDSLIAYAFSFRGKRYRRGGVGITGFDCSGYTLVVFRKFGVKLPHSAAGQSLIGYQIKKNQIGRGDLLFFRARNRRGKLIGHVGIAINMRGDPIQFIHSSTSSGVRVDYLETEYYRKRFMKAARVLPYH